MLDPTPKLRYSAFVIAASLLAPLPCYADSGDQPTPEALKRLSLEELSQIQVTSPTKEPEPVIRAPAAVYVITADDIRRSGALTIPDALRLAPGVEVAQIDSNKWSVGIRGFGTQLSRSVLVLVDGRSVYTTFFAGTYWDVQDTVLDDIDRIEIIRGPGGTVWGPNAVNGVINIITKHTRDTQGQLVSAVSGTQDQGELQYRYGGAYGKDVTYRVYAKAFTRGPEYHPDQVNYDDWRAARTGFRVDWNHGERDQFFVEGDLYRQESGQRVTVVSYTQPFSRVADQNADLSGGNVTSRWNHKLRNGADFQLEAYYDRTNRYEANFGEVRDTFDLDFVMRKRLAERHSITWGLGARSSRGVATEVTTGLVFNPAARTDYLATAFLQDEISLLTDRLSLTLGVKLLRTNFTGIEPQPTIRLMYTPSRRASFWAAFTRALRTPSRADRDFNLSGYIGTSAGGTPFFARFNANPDFTSEQLNGYEAGYRQLLTKTVYIDVATFYNHYHDLFSQDLAGPVYFESSPAPAHLLLPARFGNGLLGTTKGYEVGPEWQPFEWLSLKSSYSYLLMRLAKAPGSVDLGTAPIIERSSPRHQAFVESNIQLRKRLELDLVYRYSSALPGIAVPGYSTGDARLAWRLRGGLEVALVGRNLLQPRHVEFAADPGPNLGIRREAYLRLAWIL